MTALLTAVLAGFYLRRKGKKWKDGELSLVFLLCYCAAQLILDSTRYDSMYFRSNGFVSVVQVLGAVAIVAISVFFSVRLVKKRGFRGSYVLLWVLMLALLGGTGYMEYFVQRHGNQVVMGYSVMSVCLCVYTSVALWIRAAAGKETATS